MATPLLYSTNPWIKLIINERFRGDKHYVWCSEYFDSTKQPSYSGAALIAPSSDPCSIYKQLQGDVSRRDAHSAKIKEMKSGLESITIKWRDGGDISHDDAEEIFYMLKTSDFSLWKPLVYVIPRTSMDPSRIQLVPPARRASAGLEYIIDGLDRSEFDVIEL